MRQALAAVVVGGLLIAADARAADDAAIKQALQRGVQYLRSAQVNGVWPYQYIGATALAGLTLLECDVPANDPAVQAAAKAVREASAANLTHTYSLALAIVFLDRLGEPGDVPQIESLTVRLLAIVPSCTSEVVAALDPDDIADIRHVLQRYPDWRELWTAFLTYIQAASETPARRLAALAAQIGPQA